MDAVRQAWEQLAGSSARFCDASSPCVVVAPDSRLCPLGWCGLVTITGATIATAPDTTHADVLRRGLENLLVAGSTGLTPQSSSTLTHRLPVSEVLGPTDLAYLLTALPDSTVVAADGARALDVTSPIVQELLAACSPEDAAEAAIDTLTSPAFVVLRDGAALAVAGYERWSSSIAHLCVLTHPAARGTGLARVAAAAATDHAVRAGLLPQWRARPTASRRVAHALGYQPIGHQLSVRLAL